MRWAGWAAAAALTMACGTSGPMGGNAPPDGGGGAVLPPAGGASDGGPDAGPVDAGPPPDCLGLVPADAGPAYTFDVPSSAGLTCTAATSDGKGVIAAEAHDAKTTTWNEFGTNGAWNGNFGGGPEIFGQPDGFEGAFSGMVILWSESGAQQNFALVESGAVAAAAFGGAGTVAVGGSGGAIVAHRIDAAGNETGRATASIAGTPVAAADDASGAVLGILTLNGVATGIWFDPTAGTAGAPFTIGAGTAATAKGLIGGGVAVALDGRWKATLQPNDATLHPAPAWLHDGDGFAIIRGAKAYGVPRGGAVEVVSPKGSACGPLGFSGVGSVSIGADGTVIGSNAAASCTKVFWPGVLK